MKAIVCPKYGPPENLQIKDIPKPVPKEDEVLVRVRATAINDYDWSLVRGKPHLYRLLFGLRKPKNPVPGMELAGTVEAVGKEVTTFKTGDAVYGDLSDTNFGSFAEYASIPARALVAKPAGLSFEEAAAIPHATGLAVQGLIDVGNIQKGQRILINGAGGGVGTFGFQIAKHYDAEVTGVDTGDKLQRMKSLGFDHVIDYKKEDFTKNGEKYDLVLDAKTTRPTRSYLRALKSGGKYVSVGGHVAKMLQLVVLKPFISAATSKSVHMVALESNKNLDFVHKLYENGRLKPVIDGPYPLEEVPRLIRYFGEGKHTGKIVVIP